VRSAEKMKQIQEAHATELQQASSHISHKHTRPCLTTGCLSRVSRDLILLQLRAAHDAQSSATSGRMAETLRRADDAQASADRLHAKCKDYEAQLQVAQQAAADAEKRAVARELLVRQHADAEASHMCRQLKSEHEAAAQALQSQLKGESAAVAAEVAAHARTRQELDSSRSAHAAALAEKDRVIAAKHSELSDAEVRLQSQKQRAKDDEAAAASSHALALQTQESAHAAAVEALQLTYEMQLRQLRATSQGAIESVGKSQEALTSVRLHRIIYIALAFIQSEFELLTPRVQVLDSRLADLQRHHREEMAQVVSSHSRQMQQVT